MKRRLALVLLMCPLLFAADTNDPVKPVSTATPLQQLAQDMFQILNPNYQGENSAYGQTTQGLYQTNYGVWGMDQGPCTALPNNQIFCIWGDTITTYWDTIRNQWNDFQFADTCQANGLPTGGHGDCLGQKAMSLTSGSGGLLPDYSGCSAIVGVDTSLTAGGTPAIGYSGCPSPVYITNSSHNLSLQPAMASQDVSGLGSDADGTPEVLFAGHTAGTAFVVNNDLYIEWNVTKSDVDQVLGKPGQYHMESILLNCGATNLVTASMTSELPCTKQSVWSQAPTVLNGTATVTQGSGTVTWASGDNFASYMTTSAGGGTGAYPLTWVDPVNHRQYMITGYTDPTHITISPVYSGASGTVDWNVMQNQETNIGKFIDSTTSVFAVAGLSWASGLPASLQSASNIVCTFGSSWAWRQSNLYLMCMDAANIGTTSYSVPSNPRVNGAAGGLTQAYYLTNVDSSGNPSWTLGAEQSAIPLLTTYAHTCESRFVQTNEMCINIGQPSVRYSPALQRFVLTYGSAETLGLQIRTSATPWGPWSVEQQLLPDSAGSWDSKMVSNVSGGYRFNLSMALGQGPHNQPITCPNCTGGVATNIMYESGPGGNPATQVSATDFPAIDTGGNFYAPYQYPVEHDFGNGTVGLYFHAAAGNPYVPFDFSVIMNQAAAFTLSSNPTALTIASPGGGANATVTISPGEGFSGTVNVSCTVAYNGTGTPNEPPTCSLTPAQVSITSPNSANTTLSIASTASQMALVRPKPGSNGWAAFAGSGSFLVAVVFAGFLPRQRPSRKTLLRRIGLSAFLMIVALMLLMAPACGGGGGSANNNPGTTTGSYTVTVTASSGSSAASISVPLTVQ